MAQDLPEKNPANKDTTVPKQRALVFQGSAALGAYEAGVFNVLYDILVKKDRQNGEPDRPLFDIIAGTSAGAMNAAILTSYVKNEKRWKGSSKHLEDFWRNRLATPTPPLVKSFLAWQGEAARRYFSAKEFLYEGVKNVFSPPQAILDFKFLDNTYLPTNTRFLYSNQPLRESYESVVKFPIATGPGEPRLLIVSVDVQESQAVTFDSYPKNDGTRKTEYGKYILDKKNSADDKFENKTEKMGKFEHVIRYDEGITADHVMASCSVPVNYDYQRINGREFWDGGIISNTPLRELIHMHRDYYWSQKGQPVPDLVVYVVDVWPSKRSPAPTDYDGVKDRKNDIMFSDKTRYDKKVSHMITDYVLLAKDLIGLAESKGASKKEMDEILSKEAYSRSRCNLKRKYSDLIEGRFNLDKVVRIERKDDPFSISNKWADYTTETIDKLIKQGEKDALDAITL